MEILITIAVIALMLTGLALEKAAIDVVFFGGLAILLLCGIISPQEALTGFSNPGVMIIALLFIVSAAIRNTGALSGLLYTLFGPRNGQPLPILLLRMMVPVSFLSAFVNNTPLVIIFIPIIRKWTEQLRIAASKFYIPLSYAAILGGMCTLIGTSTNLVVHGMMIAEGLPGFSMFELAQIGIPCVLIGWLYLSLWGVRTLPDHKDMSSMVAENKKEYFVEMKVRAGCELIGKTISDAGLRNLRGLFLLDIEREGTRIGPISSKETIEQDDRLMFVGVTSAIIDLQDIAGLVPAAHDMFEKDFSKMRADFLEAVVSANSPVLGKTVKEANFRGKYGAGVVAVHRNGERVEEKIGSIKLRAGDTLLLLAPQYFLQNWKESQDFYLISSIKTKAPDAQHKGLLTLLITGLMIVSAAVLPGKVKLGNQSVTILHCVFAACALLVLTRCIRPYEARKSMRWDVLITIACALGISKALQASGLAALLAEWIVGAAKTFGPHGVLLLIFLVTAVITEVVTNNAAAALSFPIALAAAQKLGVDPKPFFVAVTIAASASFSTPIGYQTNLIVQGAGGYKFADYLRAGLPLNLIALFLSILLIPVFWHF